MILDGYGTVVTSRGTRSGCQSTIRLGEDILFPRALFFSPVIFGDNGSACLPWLLENYVKS